MPADQTRDGSTTATVDDEQDDVIDDEQDDEVDQPDDDADEPLDEGGKKALERERADRKAAQKRIKELERQLRGTTPSQPDKPADQPAKQPAATTDATAQLLQRISDRDWKQSVTAAAAGKLQNPQLALRLLDRADLQDEFGLVDEAAVTEAISELLTQNPYLKARGRKTTAGADSGARSDAPAKGSDIESMNADEWYEKTHGRKYVAP